MFTATSARPCPCTWSCKPWCRQIMDEAAFQAEVFKLRSREWPYYLAANRDTLQAVPDLSDLSGGLSNPTQFDFLMYILWKARQQNTLAAEFAEVPFSLTR